MEKEKHPCADGLTPECFEKHPRYAKKVFAYKLLQAICPAPLTMDLLGMLWRHLVEIPISWIPYEYFIIPEDFPTEELFPDDWVPDDPLPEGIIVEPGTEFPDDWVPGDPLPDNVTLDLEVLLPDVWTVGEDLPFGITVDPDFRLSIEQLKLMGIFIEPGKTWEEVFPNGWDPTTELPDGASWKPYVKVVKPKPGAVPPLYLSPWEPGPAHRPTPTPVTPEAIWFWEPFDDLDTHGWTIDVDNSGTVTIISGECLLDGAAPGDDAIIYRSDARAYPVNIDVTLKARITLYGAAYSWVYIYTDLYFTPIKFGPGDWVRILCSEGWIDIPGSWEGIDLEWKFEIRGNQFSFYRNDELASGPHTLWDDSSMPGYTRFQIKHRGSVYLDFFKIIECA